MSTRLIPQTFWFRLAFRCPRIEGIPRPDSKGRLLDLPDPCRIPDVARLDSAPSWASIRAGWNPNGLGVSVEVTGMLLDAPMDSKVDDLRDGFNLWIDTRDTREIHRASRFCHRFSFGLVPRGPKTLDVRWDQKPIHRAQTDAPRAPLNSIQTRAEPLRKGWRIEAFLTSEALNGFDPDTNRRLGFMIQANDLARGDQWLGVGREFPVAEDPSLWATLELSDEAP